jgi:hypothetical protein
LEYALAAAAGADLMVRHCCVGRWWMAAELLAERGITVDHVTIYRWVQRFTPEFIEAARPSGGYTADCNLSR